MEYCKECGIVEVHDTDYCEACEEDFFTYLWKEEESRLLERMRYKYENMIYSEQE